MKPFEYQEKIVHDTREAYKQGIRRPIIQLPTGGGKTFVAGMIFKSACSKNKKVLFLCDKITLCEQAAQSFHKQGFRVGIIQQGYRGDSSPDILVASVQSIEKAPKLPNVDLIIRDEGHILRAYDKKIMEAYNNVLFCALSATPWSRALGAPGYYEKIIKGPSVQEMIDMGRLVDSDIWAPSEADLEGIGQVGGEFNQKQVGEVTAKRVGEVVDQWLEIGSTQQTMISAVNCADSIAIVDKLVAKGIRAFHVDYKTKITQMYKKGGIIDLFKAGEIQVLSSVFKLSIGIDLPNCTCLVFAAPTKSLIRHIQFWGRGIRSYNGKEHCTVIDMVGNINRKGFNTDEMPQKLDDGKAPESGSTEYEKREPSRCKSTDASGRVCGAEKKGSRTCPVCGFTPTPDPGIKYIDGVLVNETKLKETEKFKSSFAKQLLHYSREKGYKDAWAYMKYKEKFNEEPSQKLYRIRNTEAPGLEVLNYIKYLNIKYARRNKSKQTTH